MGKALAIHSYKGGTGKTSISANLAATYAKKGLNVCLLDYDFRAPSLKILFKEKIKRSLNEFLEEKCSIFEATVDLSNKYKMKGKLIVGFADPSTEVMREMMTKDRKWEMQALHLTLSAKESLYRQYNIDYIIFDTSPGIYYSSINALAASDYVLLVTKMDEFDFEGTKELIHGIYNVLGRKAGILLNKIPAMNVPIGSGEVKMEEKLSSIFNLPILGIIPCYCDVQADGGKTLHSLQQPDHPFPQHIEKIVERINEHFMRS
jgi:MinD-like ATPase involved in chromosome partitioning or flagellar assembly